MSHTPPRGRRATLQFETDAPIAIKSVFYIPQGHKEKMGMGQQEPAVSLYSRKVRAARGRAPGFASARP